MCSPVSYSKIAFYNIGPRTVNEVTKCPMKIVVVMKTHNVAIERSLYSSFEIT